MQGQDVAKLIDDWLKERPAWYSLALHAALQGECSSDDIDALAKAACEGHGINGIIASDKHTAPYSRGDLDIVGMSEREVVLKSVTATSGVNALAPRSKLDLATSGLTIVYGRNGSGKSGFCRIMRNACTSRSGAEDILSNVFEEGAETSVSIEAVIDGVAETLSWSEGEGKEYPFLPEVAFFDSACAAREVENRDNEILYNPRIIEALTRFSGLVSSVGDRIRDEEEARDEVLDERSVPNELRSSVLIQKALCLDDSEEAEGFVRQAEMTAKDAKRLSELPSLIKSDPNSEIPMLERRLDQLRKMRANLAALYTCCQSPFIETYEKATDELEKAEGAACAARKLLNQNSKLDGIGGEEWRELWEAARRYSDDVAYLEERYPYGGSGALCPLCQQPLSEEASERMNVFEQYVTGAAEKNLSDKKNKAKKLVDRFVATVTAVLGDERVVSILSSEDARNQFDLLVEQIQGMDTVPAKETLERVSKATEDMGKSVRSEIEEADRKLETAKESAKPGAVERMNEELLALRSRGWVAERAATIVSDAGTRATKRELQSIRSECGTRGISSLISNVSRVEIVERMQQCFRDELRKLRATDQRVSMSAHVRSGQERQKITLKGTSERASRVLSEGEQKVVALAGFFALLDVMPTSSTVVLDDPITSLDHIWRRTVAERIVKESGCRPVVIFTHEPLFCVDLSDVAREAQIPVEYRTVHKRGSITGIVVDELDWDACRVKERISKLKDMATDIKGREKAGAFETDGDRDAAVTSCYNKLRSTWERAVEEVLLNEVVQRAQRAIHTQQLRCLDDITKEDIETVDLAMSKCSRITDAHDDPLAPLEQVPTVEELSEDIEELFKWTKEIRRRRQRA